MNEIQPVIFVVDDDPSVRKSLQRLLSVSEFQVETFGSAREFLQSDHNVTPSCLILDVRLPGLDGLELQKVLAAQGAAPPIVFITGHGDIPMSVQAMKAGAIDFLSKPFSEEALLSAVEQAIDKSRREGALAADIADIRRRMALLTPRELEVLRYVAAGQTNKLIASELGVTEKTVKVHRGRGMEKIQAQSVAGLVRMLEKVENIVS
jgi:FixJ family two-component response regulator